LHHYPRLAELIQTVGPDVIHLWEEPWSFVTLQAVILRRLRKPSAAIVLEVDQNIQKRLPPPFQQIRRHVLREVDFILARSPSAVDVVRANGYAGPTALIDYGVDRAIFRRLDREACRAEFGFKGFTVGFVGRLIVEKGLDDLFEGVRLCKENLSLAVMGEGPDGNELVKRGNTALQRDKLKFFPWGSPHKVARFLNAVDVLVVVTRTTRNVKEQFGRIIIEAHSCGVPVIGSECGAIPDIVGEGGWIVPERAPEDIARTLDAVVRNPELRNQAIHAGESQIQQRFNFDKVAGTLADSWNLARELRRSATNTHVEMTGLSQPRRI
jgi:glycosyltransferase involved in cell wall biosynthesis